MVYFFPPENKILSAGEKHVLFEDEAEYMQKTGTIIWDDERKGYVLAPDKTWDNYVQDSNTLDPPDIEPMYHDDDDEEDEYWSDGSREDFGL